jgi:hypothetical protein
VSTLRRAPAWTLTAALAVVYLIAAPPSSDLAAASYRSHLFSQFGFSLWDNSWYAGHHLLAYSLLAPALSSLIGPQPLAAISMCVAAALFALVIRGRFSPRAERISALWFALGAAIGLLSSRVPFDLGLAIALGTVVVAQRGRFAWALALALLTSLASPVAGAFLALAMLAWALTRKRRLGPAVLGLAALAPIALLSIAFPEGGSQPFVASAFYPALAGVIVIGIAIPAEQRTLRAGAALYALVLIGSFLIPSAVGGNSDRLGALVAGPVAALVLAVGGLAGRRARALIVLAPLLLYWQANAPVADFASAASDPAVSASYYAPLLSELRTLGVGYGARPARIEVVATVDHWEARWVAPHVMLARGWERQLDRERNGLFYGFEPLNPATYRRWLTEQAISLVALPDAPLDYSAKDEAALLRDAGANGAGVYLHELWHSRHWRLFAVAGAAPLAEPPARITAASSESFTLTVPHPGDYELRLRFTPYWAIADGAGCVAEAPGGWTTVQARRPGFVHGVIRFSLGRVLDHGPRCG